MHFLPLRQVHRHCACCRSVKRLINDRVYGLESEFRCFISFRQNYQGNEHESRTKEEVLEGRNNERRLGGRLVNQRSRWRLPMKQKGFQKRILQPATCPRSLSEHPGVFGCLRWFFSGHTESALWSRTRPPDQQPSAVCATGRSLAHKRRVVWHLVQLIIAVDSSPIYHLSDCPVSKFLYFYWCFFEPSDGRCPKVFLFVNKERRSWAYVSIVRPQYLLEDQSMWVAAMCSSFQEVHFELLAICIV